MALGGLYRPRLGAVTRPRAPADELTWLRRVTRVAGIVLAAELLYIPFHSPSFAVTRVEVRGDPRLAAEVAARIYLPPDTNLLRAPTAQLVTAAKRLPAVRHAQVHRDVQRRIILTVERREAMAVIRGDERATLIDPTGVVFSIRNDWGWGLPEFSAPRLSAGDTASPAARAEIAALLKALRALGPDPRLHISRVAMDREGELEVILESGARVRLGSTDRLEVKAKLLGVVLDQLDASRIEFLDLHDPLTAYWRERGAKSPAPAVVR